MMKTMNPVFVLVRKKLWMCRIFICARIFCACMCLCICVWVWDCVCLFCVIVCVCVFVFMCLCVCVCISIDWSEVVVCLSLGKRFLRPAADTHQLRESWWCGFNLMLSVSEPEQELFTLLDDIGVRLGAPTFARFVRCFYFFISKIQFTFRHSRKKGGT